jgi:hypothetical protein
MVSEKLLVYLMLRRGPLVSHDMGLCARDFSRGVTTPEPRQWVQPKPANLPVINHSSTPKFPVTTRRKNTVAVRCWSNAGRMPKLTVRSQSPTFTPEKREPSAGARR